MKAYTDLEQSEKLSEILPFESADMYYHNRVDIPDNFPLPIEWKRANPLLSQEIPCWSLAALLKCLSKIKPQVYTPILFPSEDKWILQFAEYSHGNVCEVSCDNPIDTCYEIILKLHEQNLL